VSQTERLSNVSQPKETEMSNAVSQQAPHRKVFLSFGHKLRMADWLRAHQERLTKERPSLEEVATEMTKDLGMAISHLAVKGVRKEIGITWITKREGIISANKHTLFNSYQRLRILERAVVGLYQRLAEEMPEELAQLMSQSSNATSNS
jgi:hypothetical protein